MIVKRYKNIFLISFLAILAIFSIFFIDINLASFVKNNQEKLFFSFFNTITYLGSFTYIVLINTTFIIYYLLKNKYSKIEENKNISKNNLKILLYGATSQSISALIIQLLKFIFGRMRPYYFLEKLELNNNILNSFTFFNYNDNLVSFPSGHSAGIWALIATLLFIYKNNKIVKIFLILLALSICISRIVLNVHYLSDIIIGALLGFFISRTIIIFFINKKYW